MTTSAMNAMAGFDWLKRGVNLGRNNPKAVFGGAALLLLLALLPTLVTLPVQLALTPGVAGQLGIMAFSMLASLLLVPLIGGYLRLIHAVELGHPARATDIFDAYRNGGAWPLIGFGLAMLLVYVVAVVAIVLVAGTGIFSWYLQAMAASQGGGDPAALQQLPDGFGLVIALGSVIWLFLGGMYSIGFGQVAIARRGVFAALGDGAVGTLKNVLPLLVLMIASIVAGVALCVVLLLLGLLLGLLVKLVGGVWLLVVIAVPAYIALLLAIYVVTFGVMYHLWRDVCGDDYLAEAPADALTA